MVTAAELPLTAVGLAGAVVGATVAGADVGAVVAVGGALVLAEVLPPQPARNNAITTTPRMPDARNRRIVSDFKDIK
jgi:hypothetical protein